MWGARCGKWSELESRCVISRGNRKKRMKVMLWPCHWWSHSFRCGAVCTCRLRLRCGAMVPVSYSHRAWSFWDVATSSATSKWSAMANHDWPSRCLPRHAQWGGWIELFLESPLARPGRGALMSWSGCRTTSDLLGWSAGSARVRRRSWARSDLHRSPDPIRVRVGRGVILLRFRPH